MPKYVYAFHEGGMGLKDLLGGKGANLAEMTKLSLPVPPGFTITTEACNAYLASGSDLPGLADEVREHLDALEDAVGKKLGAYDDPLLLAVRSGARFSMPGMMDTVLNIGLNDISVEGLSTRSGNDRFARDAYRRLIQMFGKTVLGVPAERFERALDRIKRGRGAETDHALTADDLRDVIAEFKDIVRTRTGAPFPQDPHKQLLLATHAVFDSWNGERARLYRRREGIADDLGTAVNVMSMVFGNLGPDSGTGVAFTRDPSTGAPGPYGDYLTDAQGEDVVAGIRNTVPFENLEKIDKRSYDELRHIMSVLERHYKDLCDVEFTIEHGRLWMLQTRVGKRTARAAFRIASDLVDEGIIDLDEALARLTGHQLVQLMFPQFETNGEYHPITHGIGASPGAAVGKVVFTSEDTVAEAGAGERVILVRRETNPDDLPGMIAAEGILTSHGGKTSHAAVVARGMGKTCVCGADDLDVDIEGRQLIAPENVVIHEGDIISIDGTTGAVYLGSTPVVASTIADYFEGHLDPERVRTDLLVRAVERIMRHADDRRKLGVRANADSPADAERAARYGAAGIGLCRTEHMFLGDRRLLVEQLILAENDAERHAPLDRLLELQRGDFEEILAAMDGKPVTIRLLDPPLHEFLPDLTELAVRVATIDERLEKDADLRLLNAVRRLHEQNPMLGLRGVRLGLTLPGLYDMQVQAIAEATIHRLTDGFDPRPQIMVPLVADARELELARADAQRVVEDVSERAGVHLYIPIGTMIELPRAALTAGSIARFAEFFSFGTNDLTQTTWGMSRDDAEGSFFTEYLDKHIFRVSPFQSLDVNGVGRLVEMASRDGRATRPNLEVGVCGEHGGDPRSVHFFHATGLDYVSCSPFSVPTARLEAGRASLDLGDAERGSDSR